ncbi:MutS-related protein [Massilia sp. DWR3-1-1]|uniref:MutS-related protein n=1 Tax=Massilia sp. DWR3-1-1 TaxID=2804559 RepID=UPI003CE7A729
MTVSTVKPGTYWGRLRNFLRSLFFIPDPDLAFSFQQRELAQLHANTAVATTASIDDQTWGDLLIDRYTAMLAEGVSIFGQQVLYQRLRAGSDEAACTAHCATVKALMADPEQLDRLHHACRPLRRTGIEIAGLLFGQRLAQSRPAWTRWLGLAGPGFLAAVGATFVWPLAWVAVGLVFGLLLAIRFRYIAAIEGWNLSMESLQRLLGVCSTLGEGNAPLPDQFAGLRGRAGQINRGLSRSPIVMSISGAKDYLDWFALTNVLHYFRCQAQVDDNIAFLRQCHLLIANLEADIALARHLQATPLFCWAQRHAGPDIAFHAVRNPLLAHAMPLSIDLAGKGAFISGQNGVGKSTLLRTIGLNLVVARAFGFCYATGAAVSTRPVYASMQNEDAMLGGESLYIAELRRAKELLASFHGPHAGIYIIDEIFRGTNYLESVSAAVAVLEELASKSMVIVSSHNLVLAPLLAPCLTPLCVSMSHGDSAQLSLLPGVLVHTNGISLLSERGFDARLQTRASAVFDCLNRYLAHPTAPGDAAVPG